MVAASGGCSSAAASWVRVLRSSGGRVLCVTALGDSVRVAQQRALGAVRQVRMDGAHWRNDIGHRAIKH